MGEIHFPEIFFSPLFYKICGRIKIVCFNTLISYKDSGFATFNHTGCSYAAQCLL